MTDQSGTRIRVALIGYGRAALLANSGAEPVENAFRIARKATGRQTIVTFDRPFHGRTLLAMSLTAKVMP